MKGQLIERTTARDRKLKRQRFQLRVYLRTDAAGKKIFYIETFAGKPKAAEARLNELVARHGKGELSEQQTLTVSEFLEAWIKDALDGSVSPRTFSDYSWLMRRYVEPAIGHIRLSKLTPLQVQGVYGEMRERGLSPRSIRHAHVVFKKALNKAVDWHYIATNPAARAELPKRQRREMLAMTVEEAEKFLNAARGTKFEALWNLALNTGMRPEEYFALKWSDVSDGVAHIQRVVCQNRKGGGYYFAEPKTPKSRRPIPLGQATIEALERHRARQLQERLIAGHRWKDYDLIFPNQCGEPMSLSNLTRRHFKPLLEAAKLSSKFTLYSLRHTHATLMLSANVHSKIVSERLGHSSITLTLDTYSHVLPGMQAQATDTLESLLFSRVQKGGK